MSPIRQTAEFFRSDYNTAWVGTAILAAPLLLANLFGTRRSVLEWLLPDMAIWVLLVALVTFLYATKLRNKYKKMAAQVVRAVRGKASMPPRRPSKTFAQYAAKVTLLSETVERLEALRSRA